MNPSPTDTRLSTLADIQFRPLNASLQPLPLPVPRAERRDNSSRIALLRRIRSEFDEMPGTALTLAQATRLFGLSPEICGRIFAGLIVEGGLLKSVDGRYRRRSDAA